MMRPAEWLMATQGLGIAVEELDAIRDFTLLWGLFEGQAMATRGSQQEVVAAVGRMAIPTVLPVAFTRALGFWRNRYWQGDSETPEFHGLKFAENPHRAQVLIVLSGGSDDPVEIVITLLQIAMRLRNNLFHGVKWQYKLFGQFENFSYANSVLMAATDLSPPTA